MDLRNVLASFPQDWLHFFGYLSVSDNPHLSSELWLNKQRESLFRSVRHLDLDKLVASLTGEEAVKNENGWLFVPRIICLPTPLQGSVLLFLSRNASRISEQSRKMLESTLETSEQSGTFADARVASMGRILWSNLRRLTRVADEHGYYKFSCQTASLVGDFIASTRLSSITSATAPDLTSQASPGHGDSESAARVKCKPVEVIEPDEYADTHRTEEDAPSEPGVHAPSEYVRLIKNHISEQRFGDAAGLFSEALLTMSSEDLLDILETSDICHVPKEELWLLWTATCQSSASISYANCVMLCKNLVGTELVSLTGYAHRDMVAALIVVLHTFPDVLLKEAIVPLVLSPSFCAAKCECILRVLRGGEFSTISINLLESICSAKSSWNDAGVTLVEGLVKGLTSVPLYVLQALVKGLKINAEAKVSDLKYGKLVLDVVSRFLTVMDKTSVEDIKSIATGHKTFVAKSIQMLIAKNS